MSDSADDDRFVVLRRRMARALTGFVGGLPEGCDPWGLRGGLADPGLFPVPELVLFALRDVMHFPWSGVGEKVRWSVYATVEGEPFVFELRKFGFAIGHRDGVAPELLRRVSRQLSSSLRLLEPLLEGYAGEQIAEGNLTMANRFGEFDNRYRHFRSLADRAFGPDPEPTDDAPQVLESGGAAATSTMLTTLVNRGLSRQQEGYFASGAMVDAYFSRLEHRVLLLRAFTGRPLANGDFEAFLGMTWDERLRLVADMDTDPERGRLLGRLRDVKATIRNPLAHGGVENDGGAFYFHLDRIGAIPANLSRYRGRLRASFFPITDGTHADVCALFDEFDAVLSEGALELPNEFVRWGIDPQFDADAVARYAEAIAGGAEAVEALVNRLGHEWEQHVNMDY